MASFEQIVVTLAFSLLAFMLGMLINQRMTKRTWLMKIDTLKGAISDLEKEREQLRQELESCRIKFSALSSTLQNERRHHQNQIQESKDTHLKLQQQFEGLANKIFQDKQKQFNELSSQQLGSLLTPLSQQLEHFKQQMNQQQLNETKERSKLHEQIEQLKSINLTMSQEAINLTNALKGDNKQQGNWGEMILERILQDSGLRNGHEYQTQASLNSDQGKTLRPDVVVHLPNERDIIIDSKVSLVSYERHFSAEDNSEKAQHLKQHIDSIAAHIKGLTEKNYHKLYGVNSLDYVMLFIPIESAFTLALSHKPQLVQEALKHNIMLVSPTNMMVALRTIDNLWRMDRQEQNAKKIADMAGKLYDKLYNYLEDMHKVSKSLESAQVNHQKALNKLVDGRGNILSSAEKIKSLGANASKNLTVSPAVADNSFVFDE